MIWSAVLPDAARRMMRTAAGRRALHVMLLVGGLFVLGVLCGARAQAAEGVPSLRDVAGQVVDASPERRRGEPTGREPVVPRSLRSGQDSPAVRGPEAVVPEPGLRPVIEGVVRSVEARVVRPVEDGLVRPAESRLVRSGSAETRLVRPAETRLVRPVVDLAETVTDGLGTVAQAKVPPLEALTTLPGLTAPPPRLTDPLSGLPDRPAGLSDLPGLPDLLAPTGLPGRTVPDAPSPQTLPSTTEPAAADASGASEDPTVSAAVPDARSTGGAAASATAVYGPASVASAARPAAQVAADRTVAASGATTPTPTPGPTPARRSPTGDPDGALGTGAGADHGTARHGDAHAVTPHHRIPFRLVPGALVCADAPETRDRYRDVPVSPA
ncbi:hypothetical protein [Streptomyces sp. MA25(2023)]|uniref:hypothetical protein n=1 Tax=Streptomyces sp. MA25(2023) TaxID=3055078 RepID=UPI0025B13CF8|nr:hypothetical protein [Streptomyces sp. MA25(2023)]MDN3252295.1 hypothetical protein [Streptomyces sp. MA25(2023)]